MKPSIPNLLSFNGGYVDTAGYLALQGLFTAHVTGNFATVGAALVFGTSGVVAKLLALPVFCVFIVGTRLMGLGLARAGRPVLQTLLTLQLVLLMIGAALALGLGPFRDGDAWQAVLTGMTLVAAMACQNAVHRIHLPSSPPSTLMTGTTTQIMVDIADVLHGLTPDNRDVILSRLRRMSVAVAAFAAGAAAAALLFREVAMGCFLAPPLVALLARLAPPVEPLPAPARGG